jgi:hypothetical protein
MELPIHLVEAVDILHAGGPDLGMYRWLEVLTLLGRQQLEYLRSRGLCGFVQNPHMMAHGPGG